MASRSSSLFHSLSGIWHCYWEYSNLSRKPGSNVTITDLGFHTDFSIYLQQSQTWLIFSKLSSTSKAALTVTLVSALRAVSWLYVLLLLIPHKPNRNCDIVCLGELFKTVIIANIFDLDACTGTVSIFYACNPNLCCRVRLVCCSVLTDILFLWKGSLLTSLWEFI